MTNRSHRTETVLITVAACALPGAAISLLCLLNLPYFYALDAAGMIRTYLAALVLLGIAAYFGNRWFVLPYLGTYSGRNGWPLIVLLTLGLAAVFVFASPYLWTIPAVEHIAICYESPDPAEHLQVLEVRDLLDGREYPPESVGARQYPATVAAGACIRGTGLTFAPLNSKQIVLALGATVRQKDNQRQVILRVDNVKKAIPLGDQDGVPNTENISIDGKVTNLANLVVDPWARKWLLLARWASIAAAAPYLALIVFGMSETIIQNAD